MFSERATAFQGEAHRITDLPQHDATSYLVASVKKAQELAVGYTSTIKINAIIFQPDNKNKEKRTPVENLQLSVYIIRHNRDSLLLRPLVRIACSIMNDKPERIYFLDIYQTDTLLIMGCHVSTGTFTSPDSKA